MALCTGPGVAVHASSQMRNCSLFSSYMARALVASSGRHHERKRSTTLTVDDHGYFLMIKFAQHLTIQHIALFLRHLFHHLALWAPSVFFFANLLYFTVLVYQIPVSMHSLLHVDSGVLLILSLLRNNISLGMNRMVRVVLTLCLWFTISTIR